MLNLFFGNEMKIENELYGTLIEMKEIGPKNNQVFLLSFSSPSNMLPIKEQWFYTLYLFYCKLKINRPK